MGKKPETAPYSADSQPQADSSMIVCEPPEPQLLRALPAGLGCAFRALSYALRPPPRPLGQGVFSRGVTHWGCSQLHGPLLHTHQGSFSCTEVAVHVSHTEIAVSFMLLHTY